MRSTKFGPTEAPLLQPEDTKSGERNPRSGSKPKGRMRLRIKDLQLKTMETLRSTTPAQRPQKELCRVTIGPRTAKLSSLTSMTQR